MDLYQGFLSPASDYRSAPFWSWNDKLSDSELKRQIRAMHEQGIGGFFMHSRVGLLTDYLSDEWMARVRTCVQEAKRLGMKAWLYDEDSYPSGYAGGFVPKMDKAFRAKGLRLQMLNKGEPAPADMVAAFRLSYEGDRVVEAEPIPQADISTTEHVAAFHLVYAADSTWFNGYSYIDTRNPDAVDEFLRITHEAYRERFGDEFGGVIPGIFTDEPQASANGCPEPCVPWTERFPDHFQERKGYDLLACLPSLFLDVGDTRKVRLDFWDVHTQLFAEIFCKRVFDWCEHNGLKLTGHFWEHTFPGVAHTGSTMPHYEYMQVPGIDLLFNQYGYDRPHGQGMQFGNVMMVREVGSVARQMGHKQVLSETYGGAGWDLEFRDQKRIGDWEYCLGVNFLCQHLSLCSLRGCRKRDFPPSFLPHQPWWPLYRLLGDYFGRLSFMLAQGEAVADILVLHPYSSIWALTGGLGAAPEVHEIAGAFLQLNTMLAEIHRGFDLGDETIIARHGRVERTTLLVGQATYKAVVVPPCLLIRETTLALLERFAANGGKIVCVEPVPSLVDAEVCSRLDALLAHKNVTRVALDRDAIRQALAVVPADVTLTDVAGSGAEPVYYQHRLVEDRHIVFLANVSDTQSFDLVLGLPHAKRVTQWNPVDAAIEELPIHQGGDRSEVPVRLPPYGSALVVTDGDEPAVPAQAKWATLERITLDDATGKPTGLNSAILDRCACRIGRGEWSEPVYVQAAFKAAREHFGLVHDNDNRGVQLWLAHKSIEPLKGDTCVALRYEFMLDCDPPHELYLVSEIPERLTFEINGGPVCPSGEHWLDPAFQKIDIREHVRKGRNQVVVTCPEFAEDVEIEACYLLGDFAAAWQDGGLVLRTQPGEVRLGDWCEQGYPFFAGTMLYRAQATLSPAESGERLVFGLDEWDGAAARVHVNGHAVGPLAWPPYEVDVTKHMVTGKNDLAVEVFTSLRNLLGPHHIKDYVPGMVAPGLFYQPQNWRDDYDLVPQGLMSPAWIERRTARI